MDYNAVDCFCGSGGLSLGLIKAGFNIKYGFDRDPKCIETIELNKKYFKHISEIEDIENMFGNKLFRKIGIDKGKLFLLAGGPPCQGFSYQRVGSDEDERNELVVRYIELVDHVYPKYFLMENVKGILGKRGKKILNYALTLADRAGYNLSTEVLDAQDYGVPQRRKRVFLIGERKDLGDSTFEFPKPLTPVGKRISVRDTIGGLPTPPENGMDHPEVSMHRRDRLSEKNKARLTYIREGQGRDFLPAQLLATCHKTSSSKIGHRHTYGRMAWDSVAPTITARFDSFTRGLFGHPEDTRTISLREGALLQTFPFDFEFAGGKVDIARQIGNAVSPKLAQMVGESIIRSHRKKKRK